MCFRVTRARSVVKITFSLFVLANAAGRLETPEKSYQTTFCIFDFHLGASSSQIRLSIQALCRWYCPSVFITVSLVNKFNFMAIIEFGCLNDLHCYFPCLWKGTNKNQHQVKLWSMEWLLQAMLVVWGHQSQRYFSSLFSNVKAWSIESRKLI